MKFIALLAVACAIRVKDAGYGVNVHSYGQTGAGTCKPSDTVTASYVGKLEDGKIKEIGRIDLTAKPD